MPAPGDEAPREDPETSDPEAAAREAFEAGLRARGEAARAVDGKLPPGATHEIVTDEDGTERLVRRRFSAF